MSLETHYSKYLSSTTLEGAMRDLEGAIVDDSERLRNIGNEFASQARAQGKWSRKEILGHLIDSAVNNHQRFVRAQIHEHVVPPALEDGTLYIDGYSQESWVQVGRYAYRSWEDLIVLWSVFNQQILHVMKYSDEASLHTPCVINGGPPIKLKAVMVDYVGHVKHHLKQILE